MTVEYFTPSKEDIEQAPELLQMLRMYMVYNGNGHLIGYDFESLYTQEEKDAIRAQLELMPDSDAVISEFALPYQRVPSTFNPKFGVVEENPKVFTPISMTIKSCEPGDLLPKRIREVKRIGDRTYISYSYSSSEDKS